MKFALTVALALTCVSASAAIVQVSPETRTTGTSATATLSGVAAGNTLVLLAHNDQNASTQFSATDDQNDTWQSAVTAGDSTVAGLSQILYAKNVVGGSTTVTLTAGSSIAFGFRVYEITGNASLLASDHNVVSATSHNESASGINPGVACDVFISATAINSIGTPTAGNGYTSPGSGSPYDFDQYKTFTAPPTNEQGLWTTTAQLRMVGVIAAFSATTPPPSVTIRSPVHNQTFQRNVSNQANLTISGAYTGNPSSGIEANFNGGPYQTILSAPSGGTYTGMLSTQNAGQGEIFVRFVGQPSVNASVSTVGVGDVFLVTGQSNSCEPFTSAQTFSHPTLIATCFPISTGVWQECNDPAANPMPFSGSIWPLLATIIMADQNVPVAFITAGVGSTGLTQYGGSYWTKGGIGGYGGTGYSGMQSLVAASGVNGVKANIWIQGEADAGLRCPRPVYAGYFLVFAQNVQADIVGAPPTLPVVFGWSNSVLMPDGLTASDDVHSALFDAAHIGSPSGLFLGPIGIGDLSNALHPSSGGAPDSPIGLTYAARAWASIYKGAKMPHGLAALHNSAATTVQVRFDQPVKTGLVLDPSLWSVTGNGSAVSVQSVGYANDPDAVVLSLATAAQEPVFVSYSLGSPAGKTPVQSIATILPSIVGYPLSITVAAEPFANLPATLDPNLN